jgi:hypothetical protein
MGNSSGTWLILSGERHTTSSNFSGLGHPADPPTPLDCQIRFILATCRIPAQVETDEVSRD